MTPQNYRTYRSNILLGKGSGDWGPCTGQIQPLPEHACHEPLPEHNIFKRLKKFKNISWHVKIIRNSNIRVHKVLPEHSHAHSFFSMAAFSMN